MAFALPLRPGAMVDVRPQMHGWRIVQAGQTLGALTASVTDGTTVTDGDGTLWTVSGRLAPADLALWHEGSGAGAAWCSGARLRRTATIDVAGIREPLRYRDHLLRDATLRTRDGLVGRVGWKRENELLRLRWTLPERLDVASFAAAIAIVSLWLVATDSLVPRFYDGPVGG